MHTRKITKEGRVNIPVEYLDIFDLKENDIVEVSTNRTSIIIKKHRDEKVCVVTGKVSDNIIKVGDCYLSKEGLSLLKQAIVEME